MFGYKENIFCAAMKEKEKKNICKIYFEFFGGQRWKNTELQQQHNVIYDSECASKEDWICSLPPLPVHLVNREEKIYNESKYY